MKKCTSMTSKQGKIALKWKRWKRKLKHAPSVKSLRFGVKMTPNAEKYKRKKNDVIFSEAVESNLATEELGSANRNEEQSTSYENIPVVVTLDAFHFTDSQEQSSKNTSGFGSSFENFHSNPLSDNNLRSTENAARPRQSQGASCKQQPEIFYGQQSQSEPTLRKAEWWKDILSDTFSRVGPSDWTSELFLGRLDNTDGINTDVSNLIDYDNSQEASLQSFRYASDISQSSGFASDNIASHNGAPDEKTHYDVANKNLFQDDQENHSRIPHEATAPSVLEMDHDIVTQKATEVSDIQDLPYSTSYNESYVLATTVKEQKKSQRSNNLDLTNVNSNLLREQTESFNQVFVDTERVQDYSTINSSTELHAGETILGHSYSSTASLFLNEIGSVNLWPTDIIPNLENHTQNTEEQYLDQHLNDTTFNNTGFCSPSNSLLNTGKQSNENCPAESSDISTLLCEADDSLQAEIPPQKRESPLQHTETPSHLKDIPPQQTEPPYYQTVTPSKNTETSSQHKETPSQHTETPSQHAELLSKHTKTQCQHIEKQPKHTRTPSQYTETQHRDTETPSKHTKTQRKHTETPPQHTDMPSQQTEASSQDTETQPKNTEIMPQQTKTPSQDTETQPKHTETQSQHKEIPPQQTTTPSQDTETQLKHTETPSQHTEIRPQQTEPQPQQTTSVKYVCSSSELGQPPSASLSSSEETLRKDVIAAEPVPDTATSPVSTAATLLQEEDSLSLNSQHTTSQEVTENEIPQADDIHEVSISSSSASSIASDQEDAEQQAGGGREQVLVNEVQQIDNEHLNMYGLNIRNEPEEPDELYQEHLNMIGLNIHNELDEQGELNQDVVVNAGETVVRLESDDRLYDIQLGDHLQDDVLHDIQLGAQIQNDVFHDLQLGDRMQDLWPPWPIPTDIDFHRIGDYNFDQERDIDRRSENRRRSEERSRSNRP